MQINDQILFLNGTLSVLQTILIKAKNIQIYAFIKTQIFIHQIQTVINLITKLNHQNQLLNLVKSIKKESKFNIQTKQSRQMKGQITIKKQQSKSIPLKGAVAFTMPTRPEQAVSNMTSQDKQITNEIMFIPFPEIRNAIVTFMRPFKNIKQNNLPQILAVQYQDHQHLQRLDNLVTKKIGEGYHQKLKLQSIQKLFAKASALKAQVVSTKNEINKGADDDIKYKLRNIQKKADQNRQSVKEFQRQKLQNIQKQKNKEIIEEFKNNAQIYEKKNRNYIDLHFIYSQIRQYTKQMQKITPIVWRYESIPDPKQEHIVQNFIDYFNMSIGQQKIKLINNIHQCETALQLFRDFIKSESLTDNQNKQTNINTYETKLNDYLKKFDQIQSEIKINIYQKLKYMEKLDRQFVYDLQNQTRTNLKNYQRFVQIYTDIKQVVNCSNQLSDFYRIISNEEKNLSNHLRVNSGLIVFYKTTQDFQNFNKSLHKRTYVEQIFSERITPINTAIKFINQEHGQMYKNACEDINSRYKLRKKQVIDKKKVFQTNLQTLRQKFSDSKQQNNNFQYLTHLIEALSRLMALSKQ